MKHLLTCLLVVTLISISTPGSRLSAQAPPDRAAVEKTIMANEIKINDAFAKKDVATMKTMIADDGAGVDMTGFAPVAEMYKQIPTMDIKVSESKLSDFKYHWIDANNVVVIYTWTGKGTYMGQPLPSPVYASTVWTKRANAWRAVFHQETPAIVPPKK